MTDIHIPTPNGEISAILETPDGDGPWPSIIVLHDIKKYDVGHSFANQLPMQPLMRIAGFGYSPEAEADAWQGVYTFFAQHLRDDDRLQEAR
nr:dienelactone hydrolase family protein [Mycobacteroides salmoniphilum]